MEAAARASSVGSASSAVRASSVGQASLAARATEEDCRAEVGRGNSGLEEVGERWAQTVAAGSQCKLRL